MTLLTTTILQELKTANLSFKTQKDFAAKLKISQPQLNNYLNEQTEISAINLRTFEKFLPYLKNIKVLINDINIVDNSKIKAEGHSQVVTGTNIQYAEKSGQINSVAEKSTQYAEKFDNLEKEVLELEGIDPLAQIAFMKLIKKNRG